MAKPYKPRVEKQATAPHISRQNVIFE